MSTTAIDIGTLVVSTPETCGGRPRIAGTRISIAQIAVWNKEGLSVEEILEEIPYLDLAQVYAALSYYHANRNEIEADLAAELAEYQLLEKFTLGPRNRVFYEKTRCSPQIGKNPVSLSECVSPV
ncbi:MAG: DUF433 domain-containing protein [Oscillatoriales cyanobacterium]|nr:MAG: DUF433 domain-containing protein [Oscillatoriales cyanobacterium]